MTTTDEKRFTCKCGKSFKSKLGLMQHTQKAHGVDLRSARYDELVI